MGTRSREGPTIEANERRGLWNPLRPDRKLIDIPADVWGCAFEQTNWRFFSLTRSRVAYGLWEVQSSNHLISMHG